MFNTVVVGCCDVHTRLCRYTTCCSRHVSWCRSPSYKAATVERCICCASSACSGLRSVHLGLSSFPKCTRFIKMPAVYSPSASQIANLPPAISVSITPSSSSFFPFPLLPPLQFQLPRLKCIVIVVAGVAVRCVVGVVLVNVARGGSNGGLGGGGRTIKDFVSTPIRLMDRSSLRSYFTLLERELALVRAALLTLDANESTLTYAGGAGMGPSPVLGSGSAGPAAAAATTAGGHQQNTLLLVAAAVIDMVCTPTVRRRR